MANLKFYRGATDAQAAAGKDKSNAVVPDGSVIFTNEKHIFMKNGTATERYGGDDEAVSEVTSTAVTVGGLDKGTDLSGKTAMEILDSILDVEYAPKWTDATASIAMATGKNQVLSVGDLAYEPSATNFTASGNAAKAEGKTIATGGSATDTFTIATGNTAGSAVTSRKQITYTLSRAYAAGSDKVNSSKGNNTNRTASDTTTKLTAASVNSNINASTYVINAITKTNTITVSYAYPVWINGTEKLAYSTTSFEVNDVATSASVKLTCQVPATYTNVKAQYYDSVLQQWIDEDAPTSATANKTIGSSSYSVSYKTYTWPSIHTARKERISFTIA